MMSTLVSVSALAQNEEEKALGWANIADVSFVVTSGNTSNSTLAFDNKTTRTWENAEFFIRAGALRTQTTDDRFAVGTQNDFEVIEKATTGLDNERYYVRGQYQKNISSRVYWLAGAGWDRDKDQGIDHRTVLFGGLGNTWIESSRTTLKTNYAITFTRRIDDIPDPEREERFSEARFSWEYVHQLNDNNQLDSTFAYFVRMNEPSDNRFNTVSSITSSLSQIFALRFSLQLLYQNRPALQDVDLEDPSGRPVGTVNIRKDKLDAIFKFSFVVTL